MSERAHRARRGRHVQLADRRAARGLDQPRQRLRRSTTSTATSTPTSTAGTASRWPVTPTPRSSRRSRTAGRPRHPLRPADRGRDRRRRQPRRAVRPAAVAVRQLRHRGDDGRRPPDARGHRARPDPQGRGRLPRPPRLGDGLGAAGARTTTSAPPTAPIGVAGQHRHPRRDHGPGHRSCPFNDLGAVERALAAHPGEIAGMIVEPIMMNAGIIHPDDGYLAGAQGPAPRARRAAHLRRGEDRPDRRPGWRHRLLGVTPDLVCLAKAMGGGLSTAAIGGTERGDGADRRRRLRAGRHVQRQPARDGGRPGDADRGARRRRRTPTSTGCATGCATGSRTSSTGTTRPGGW